jgi:hypothetical protein
VRYLALILLMWSACGKQHAEEPLARVNDHYLYISDLSERLRQRAALQDSMVYLKSLVQDWIRQQVLLDRSLKELPRNMQDKNRQIEDYRNSLLIYDYQKLLIDRSLDTVVKAEEIRAWYHDRSSDFESRKNLVRLRYVKLPAGARQLPLFRKLLQSSSAVSKERLRALCQSRASNFFLNDSLWISFRDMLKEIPIQTADEDNFLRSNSYVEVKDREFIYLVRFTDYRLHSSTAAPETARVREMILNARKVKLIRETEQNLLKEAELNGTVEIY